jgi:hypothetical protein
MRIRKLGLFLMKLFITSKNMHYVFEQDELFIILDISRITALSFQESHPHSFPQPSLCFRTFFMMRYTFLLSAFFSGVIATNELVGYEGCDNTKKTKIDEAFSQAKKIFDVIRDAQIDWNSAAAVEFLGPPGFNQNMQSVIQGEQEKIQGEDGGGGPPTLRHSLTGFI